MKSNKYEFNYKPDANVPNTVWQYLKMVIRRNPMMWACMILSDIIHGIRYPLAFLVIGAIVDIINVADPADPLPITVWYYAGLIFVILLIGELAHTIAHYTYFDWIDRARPSLRADLLNYTMSQSYTYFQNRFAGSLARKISESVEKIKDMANAIRWEIFLQTIAMVSTAIVLLTISSIYTAIVLLFVFLIILPVLLRLKKLTSKSKTFADERSIVNGQIVDTLTNIEVVKAFARENEELEKHAQVSETEMSAWHKMLRVFLMLDNYRRATLVIFGGGLMVACLFGWDRGIITLGEITTIMGLSYGFVGNAWSVSFGVIHVSEHIGTLKDALDTLIAPIKINDTANSKPLDIKNGEIEFKNVTFQYTDTSVLKDFNLKISKGERIGLIGRSGAGKTTLINLLARFFDIQSGQIFIDDQDIKTVTQESLRKQIGLIPQSPSLFHRNIIENIRYGNLKADDDQVFEAARRANAHDFIQNLPDGYNTIVGERGVKLSGGQRQRIAIARAILKNAPILILDEATSALDSESEKYIQDSLKDLMDGKTVIAIAHRLSTISHLDRLIVMDNGKMIEHGSHEDLLAAKGLYSKLWSMQSGGFLGE